MLSIDISNAVFIVGSALLEGDHLSVNVEKGIFTVVKAPGAVFGTVKGALKHPPDKGKPTKQDPPTAKALSKIQAIGFWGEGTQGQLHLEIESVSAEYDAPLANEQGAVSTAPPKEFNTCQGPLQQNLRYNVSSLGNEYITAPVPVDKDETLADAIACDVRTQNYAEPRFLFQLPTVDLYARMNQNGTTNFYDSQCGALLFTAPVGRTFEDFQKDTNEHGWPSFRPKEVHLENFNQTTWATGDHVYSKCGTHLGSFLPDAVSDRWCMDLTPISGNPV